MSPGKLSPGKVYIYATTMPTPTDLLRDIHNMWSPDGRGGDQRGWLLGALDFDDGICFEINESPLSYYRRARFEDTPGIIDENNLWCRNMISIPSDIRATILSLYWVWDWPTNKGRLDEKEEIYTTCMDIDLIMDNVCF
jgi:hypothetical protein